MCKIRVIVIDDSAFMRKVIADLLTSDHRIEVVATAKNGEDGIKKIKALAPDVATLDVHMPVMDGFTALQHIMKTNPLPVVMLSSVTAEGTKMTVQAISSGAVDFITKPLDLPSLDTGSKQEIINKVITASQAKINKSTKERELSTSTIYKAGNLVHDKTIIAIGTSTGGPRALQKVLTDLPGDFFTPILIVQHMPKGFTKSLADRLNTLTQIHVKEASHGEKINNHTAYIAPGNYHMKAKKVGTSLVIELTQEEQVNGFRPAVDVLFDSVNALKNINKLAIVLTGMGNDGSKGVKRLKENDANTVVIAEAEETAVVYGMPRSAVKTHCVNYIVPLNQIAEMMHDIVNPTTGK